MEAPDARGPPGSEDPGPGDPPDPESPAGGAGAPPRADLDSLVAAFVARHAHRPRQRTAEWKAGKAEVIGGSEVASLLKMNPYSSFHAVVAAKAGLSAFGGNIACHWGTLFEGVAEAFVALDFGTTVRGTDISVPAPPASGLEGLHANSPDGYCVVTLFRDPGGDWRLATTDPRSRAEAAGRPTARAAALLEFKNPYRRRPRGAVPGHYLPQIWSGLALSPVAHFGLFVDAVFRKCTLEALGPAPGYDRAYHLEPACADWPAPIAWGFTAVFAPRPDAPRAGAGAGGDGDDALAAALGGAKAADPGYEAWRLHYEAFGLPFESPGDAARAGRPFRPDPVDFGDCGRGVFERMMGLADGGSFPVRHVGPCTPDGRGARLRTARGIGRAVDACAEAPPAGHFLLGVVPWKLFEIDYVSVPRRPGFLDEIRPLVVRALGLAREIRAAGDPAKAFRDFVAAEKAAAGAGPRAGGRAAGAGPRAEVQALFDELC